MHISDAQCRAGRALLDWSQDDLATNAQVARATIADFERKVRNPMRQNLVSIINTLEAGGIEFIPDNGGGVGVRFRKVELEYSRTVKPAGDGIAITMRYRGQLLAVLATREVIDDMDRTNYRTTEERVRSVQNHMPKYLMATERLLASTPTVPAQLVLDTRDFPDGVF